MTNENSISIELSDEQLARARDVKALYSEQIKKHLKEGQTAHLIHQAYDSATKNTIAEFKVSDMPAKDSNYLTWEDHKALQAQRNLETLRVLGQKVGVEWFDYQLLTLSDVLEMDPVTARLCLYYRTGAGKTITAGASVALLGQSTCLVVAPPSTHPAWEEEMAGLGITATCVSHAKFRMKDFKVDRHTAIIADEFHLFGGHTGKGWQKLERVAKGLRAPVILASATPNYNDADRVYCISRILDPVGTKGGFLDWLYTHCITEQSAFSLTPDVVGFRNYGDAEEFLANLPYVHYVPDTTVYTIDDLNYPAFNDYAFREFGLSLRHNRIMASDMERRHKQVDLNLINDQGGLNRGIFNALGGSIMTCQDSNVLVYADHSSVAWAAYASLLDIGFDVAYVDGQTPKPAKLEIIQRFREGKTKVLVGTATLATGTDGLDKVCDQLIILDDTTDDSLRRQLIGRIMPRGADSDSSNKKVIRFTPQ